MTSYTYDRAGTILADGVPTYTLYSIGAGDWMLGDRDSRARIAKMLAERDAFVARVVTLLNLAEVKNGSHR